MGKVTVNYVIRLGFTFTKVTGNWKNPLWADAYKLSMAGE